MSTCFGFAGSSPGADAAGVSVGAACADGIARAWTGAVGACVPAVVGVTEVSFTVDDDEAGVGSVWLVTWSRSATASAPTRSAPITINRMAFQYPDLRTVARLGTRRFS